jgi:hypothetical protein
MLGRIDSMIKSYDGGNGHICFNCSRQPKGIWRLIGYLIGYDEYGELWICQLCWEKFRSDECPPAENKVVKQEGA